MLTIKVKQSLTFIMAVVLISSTAYTQANKLLKDYLNIPGPVVFENKSFDLSWSSHPAANFYKQEYLPKNESADQYKTMILVDVVTGDAVIKNVVAAKVNELKQLKAGNPMVNYEAINNPATGEYMIDFVLTANAADGKSISIVERNVYRYKAFTNKLGQKGILLFGVSTRAYGADVAAFFTSLKASRKDLVKKVSAVQMPDITIK